jgi:ABC-type nitrate/sulfonate/bicarbonate transport system substrate-binding protein
MKIRIGGVPEHFNYPWHFAIENRMFEKEGLDVEWQDIKGGSGAMCNKLQDEELEIALVLTEGIVKHIANGGKSRIIQQYVKSPLIWGIHCSNTFYEGKHDLSKARFARSRVGSGSHIMPFVLAEQNGFHLSEENFVTVKNIDGAVDAFNEDQADILLWEKFMTKPLVEQGKMKKLGDLVSPWPCFVMVGSENMIANHGKEIKKVAEVIIEACEIATKRKTTTQKIADQFDLKIEDVELWFSTVEWQTSDWVSSKMLQNVSTTLHRIGLIEREFQPTELCYSKAKIY